MLVIDKVFYNNSKTALLVSSAISLILVAPGAAQAGCAPNPARYDEKTICSGAENATLVVDATNSNVEIEQGANLAASGTSSILITTRDMEPYSNSSIQIDGTVSGGTDSAIAVAMRPGASLSVATAITVSETGRIEGPVGIDVTGVPIPYYYGAAEVTLDNSGTVGSTAGGYALRGNDDRSGRFDSILNRATGTIGAIRGQVRYVNNEGLIDGGALGAIVDAAGPSTVYGIGTIANSGTIRAATAGDTLAATSSPNGGFRIENDGLIVNNGTGRAIAVSGYLTLTNSENGQIISSQTAIAGGNMEIRNFGAITGVGQAISVSDDLVLVNDGIIIGDVRSGGNSVIVNPGGTIDGDVIMGGGNDLFYGDGADLTAPFGHVTGTVDAGGGIDRLVAVFKEDKVLDSAIALPATFEELGLFVTGGTILTLSQGYTTTTPLMLYGGEGQNGFVLGGTVDTQGSSLRIVNASDALTLTNTGGIRAQLTDAGQAAIQLDGVSRFNNEGIIAAVGGSGLIGYYSGTPITNSGTITADFTGVRAPYTLNNSGTIMSLQGLGVDVTGYGLTSLNSGRIEGKTVGVRLGNGRLVNSGVIASDTVGVEIMSRAVLLNQADGSISGATKAISFIPNYYGNDNIRILNAGRIVGNVDLGIAANGYSSGNVFAALDGGVVNGDIHLGSGFDIFATSLVNDGPGEFAGLTGTISGGGTETLRYLIDSDTTTTPALKGIFAKLSYELSNDASLTLTGPTAIGVGFAGTGTVKLTGDWTGRGSGGEPLIDLTAPSVRIGDDGQILANALTVTNSGTITARHSGLDRLDFGPAIQLGEGNSFINTGLIDVSVDRYISYRGAVATAMSIGSGTMVNSGTIRLNGAYGVISDAPYGSYLTTVKNEGVIEQAVGGARSYGISAADIVINSGRIETEGAAVFLANGGRLTNSGILRSRAAEAVYTRDYYSAVLLSNEAGGLIEGGAGFDAVRVGAGSVLANAGTIQGNVMMRSSPYDFGYDFGASIFVNRGGTLNGNLTLTRNDDMLIALNGETGVTGVIDALTGNDMFVHAFDQDATVALDTPDGLPAGFELLGFAVYGESTELTLTGTRAPGDPLFLAGDGTVVNLGTIAGARGQQSAMLGNAADPLNVTGAGSTLSFVNRGTLANGVSGSARWFENQGLIGGYAEYGPAVRINANDPDSFAFRNSGTITGIPVPQNVSGPDMVAVVINRMSAVGQQAQHLFDNSGTITGGASIIADARTFGFVNSGRIDTASPFSAAVQLSVGPDYIFEYPRRTDADDASVVNSGAINGRLSASLAARRVAVTNSGSIVGALGITQPGALQGFTPQGYPAEANQDSLSLTNSGSVTGAVGLYSAAQAIDIANSGSILVEKNNIYWSNDTALSVVASAVSDRALRLVNDGSIIAENAMSSAVLLTTYPNISAGDPASTADTTISIVNRGTIRADGGAGYTNAFASPWEPQYPATPAQLTGAAAIGISAESTGASAVSIVNAQGATISAAGETAYAFASYEPEDSPQIVPDTYKAAGSVAIGVQADRVAIDNAGLIRGLAGGTVSPEVQLLLGNDARLIDASAVTASDGFLAGAVQTFHSIDSIVNRSTGTIRGSINLGDMNDSLINAGTIDGDIYLGAGDDSMVHALTGVLTGRVDGGDGTDGLTIDITGGGLLNQTLLDRFMRFESQVLSGTGTITTDGPFTTDTLFLHDAALTLDAGQRVQTAGPVAFTFAGGTNMLVNRGTIIGGLDLSNGQNAVVNAGRIQGAVNFGSGSSLIGLAGSVIDSAIFVPQGAVFGSAGTVNGAVTVSGTLAPGASPGTMTVNGNVTLNAGSDTIFEFTPVVSDTLVINGALSIADGAKMTMTGERPLTPGIHVMVSASGGITGSFGANVTRDDRIAGVLSYGSDAIRLIGLFQLRDGATAQTAATTDYLNTLLLNGQATPGVLDSLPALLDAGGYASAAVLGGLSPQPYASVGQMGIENGLAIAEALRSAQLAGSSEEGGLFTFGQAYGHWRDFAADRRGVVRANVDVSGFLGGLGYGNTTAGAALFVGRSDAKQRMSALGAENEADGLFFGGRGHYARGNFSAGVSLVIDRANAKTRRTPFTGAANSQYDLHGVTIDGWLGYGFDLNGGWQIGPQVGLTHIRVKREGQSESGGGAFALDVAGCTYRATFLNADLKLQAPGSSRLRPWVTAGVRHRVDGGHAIVASAAFTGSGTAFSVSGAERKRTLPHVGAGLNLTLASRLSLFLDGGAEFSADYGERHINSGIIFHF
jgi:fibronectin-binding autotransporter adhesin